MSTTKQKAESVARTTADLVNDQLAKLKDVFPECVAEGRVDFDRLRAMLLRGHPKTANEGHLKTGQR
jgi:hypothetical protein